MSAFAKPSASARRRIARMPFTTRPTGCRRQRQTEHAIEECEGRPRDAEPTHRIAPRVRPVEGARRGPEENAPTTSTKPSRSSGQDVDGQPGDDPRQRRHVARHDQETGGDRVGTADGHATMPPADANKRGQARATGSTGRVGPVEATSSDPPRTATAPRARASPRLRRTARSRSPARYRSIQRYRAARLGPRLASGRPAPPAPPAVRAGRAEPGGATTERQFSKSNGHALFAQRRHVEARQAGGTRDRQRPSPCPPGSAPRARRGR